MKIILLSSQTDSPSTKLLLSALKKRHLRVFNYDPRQLAVSLSPTSVFDNKNRQITGDLIIPRFGLYTFAQGVKILQAFEAMGTSVLNSSASLLLANDKYKIATLMSKSHIPIPRTWYFESTQDFYRQQKFDFPLILKILNGSQGKGVALIQNQVQLESWCDLLRTKRTPFILQELIKGQEIRSLVFKGQILANMARTPKQGEFRSNLHLGGHGTKIKLTAHEESMILDATQALKLDFAGVDFIRTKKGSSILELNAFPGLSGISQVVKLPIAKSIAEQIDKNFR